MAAITPQGASRSGMRPVPSGVRTVRSRRAGFAAGRIVGIDIARGLAVLGMMTAHLANIDEHGPTAWLAIAHGRPSILFAVLAGVSLAIISANRESPAALAQARVRIVVRAVLIFCIGVFLTALGTAIAVILEYYAVLFVLALPFLRLRARTVFVVAGVLAIVMPVLHFLIAGLVPEYFLGYGIAELLVTGNYPVMIWIVFALAGLGVGRLDLSSTLTQVRVLAAGCVLVVAGYGPILAMQTLAGLPLSEDAPSPVPGLGALLTIEPHSGSPFEVIGSTGFAMAILALSLLAARPLRWILYPIAATGALALTVYSLHILGIALVGDTATRQPDNALLLEFLLLTLVGASAWLALLGRGPLERVVSGMSRSAASIVGRVMSRGSIQLNGTPQAPSTSAPPSSTAPPTRTEQQGD